MAVVLAAGDSKPFIDWASLGKVAGVSLLFGLAVVVLFAVGVVGLSMARGHLRNQESAADQTGRAGSTQGPGVGPIAGRGVGSIIAATCFVLCAGAVAYGLWLEIPQFH